MFIKKKNSNLSITQAHVCPEKKILKMKGKIFFLSKGPSISSQCASIISDVYTSINKFLSMSQEYISKDSIDLSRSLYFLFKFLQ